MVGGDCRNVGISRGVAVILAFSAVSVETVLRFHIPDHTGGWCALVVAEAKRQVGPTYEELKLGEGNIVPSARWNLLPPGTPTRRAHTAM